MNAAPLTIEQAELRRLGIGVECAAATLNGAAQRVEAKQASIGDFVIAQAKYEFVRDAFCEQLEATTGQSSAWLERVLSL
jgi:hypothetical protein